MKMLGRLFQILLCFMVAMQPPSKSLSTDFYYTIADVGQPVLIKLDDTANAELANAAKNIDIIEREKLTNASELDAELIDAKINLTDSERSYDNKSELFEEPDVQNGTAIDSVEETAPIENVTVVEERIIVVENKSENATESDEVKSEEKEDIPSFSEWTQKQLEEAERNKEIVLNDSSHTVHNTVTSTVNLKIRSKNYASPDCGAKIVAANPEAGSASFILSTSRDEYMLNTCKSRIWFIVELCEAVQAQRVELANFELFSSTPKNFTVYVGERFPTRDWTSVGQFIAEDERDIQTFNLHPYLFGKFIKVELHSYYGSEHYCPISLFRVYGTSVYEVFETENSPQTQNDDDDDDDVLEELSNNNDDVSRNLFGSARDAVISIVKKAAEVLVKSSDSKNSTSQSVDTSSDAKHCKTPSHIIVCDNCSNALFADVYELMSCRNDYIKAFTESPIVYNALCNTDLCQEYGLDFKSKKTLLFKTEIASYISALLMPSYMAALCNMLAIIEKKVVLNTSYETDLNITSNLTIDKKLHSLTDKGSLDVLIQEPFACKDNEEFCKNKPDDAVDLTEPIVEVPTLPNADVESNLDIKPTRTHQEGSGNADENVTVYPPVESNSFIPQSSKTTSVEYTTDLNGVNKSVELPKLDTVEITVDAVKPDDNISDLEISSGEGFDVNSIESSELTDNNTVNIDDVNASQEQLALDLLNDLEQTTSDPSTSTPPTSTVSISSQGQKESVFLRLSNRIKTLEKNMSLSSQYLEELSRRYKRQVEEMQKSFEKTIANMNDERRRIEERDHKNLEEMLVLQQQIAQLTASVNTLSSEQDSWISNDLLKLVCFQTIITFVIVYVLLKFLKRNTGDNSSEVRIRSEPSSPEKSPMRRSSDNGLFLTNAEVSSDRAVKRKKKRKSNVRRSLSIAGTPDSECLNITPDKSDVWSQNNLDIMDIDTRVALEEPDFIIPEAESVSFYNVEYARPVFNEITPKRDFPKTNGLIFKPSEDKLAKVRRLSSPAFLKSAFNRQSFRSKSEAPLNATGVDGTRSEVLPRRELKSEDRYTINDASTLNDWSSAGEVSQASSSNTLNQNEPKRSKKRSLKNIFKKVF